MEASVSVSVDAPIVSTKMRNIADSFLEIILDNESLRFCFVIGHRMLIKCSDQSQKQEREGER